jgi:hypothetical protein
LKPQFLPISSIIKVLKEVLKQFEKSVFLLVIQVVYGLL